MTAKLIEKAAQQRAAACSKGPIGMAAATLFAIALAACGGGGGGADITPEQPAGVTPPTEQPTDTGASTGPAVAQGGDSFNFEPSSALASDSALDQVAGGDALYGAWNPSSSQNLLKPGMKVVFFGSATGCDASTEGTLASLPDDRLAAMAAQVGYSAAAASTGHRWTPSANVAGCDAAQKAAVGPSAVFLNAADGAGAVGLLTSSSKQSDAQVSFFGPYTAAGQDGKGTNAFITGSFVAFRQAWWAADPLQPWAGSASARVRSVQSVGAAQVDAAAGGVSQVKQQMMATFLNRTCIKEASGKPCQIQYMLNTNVVRTGVSDWSQVSWFQNGDVWFDPVQGGIPIVDGPIYGSGVATKEPNSGLELFRSQGSASQHGTFSNRTFDVTISFEALLNTVRITVARTLGIAPAAVTDAQIAAMWGSGWNARDEWVFLTGDVAQEVYNPDVQRSVWIAGGFKSLFVGPQN